jgi:UDP-glucose 4-epimerase
MSRRATVIGAAGFIGSRLVAHLRREGWECSAPARHDQDFFDQPLGNVFYCAGLTADFAQRPFDAVRAHVGLLNELLARARFDTLVYLSSARLYDRCGSPGATAIDEAAPLALDPAEPRHVYDLSKALGESLCLHASGGRARVARLSCVYGDANDTDGFLAALLRQVREPRLDNIVPVDSTLHAERDYVHVNDVLSALVNIATSGTRAVYNVAGGCNVSNARLFARIGELAGCELRALRSSAPPCPAPLSIERMRAEFGWQPAALLDQLPRLVQGAMSC